jgi:peptide/nickel transport system permease protein
MEKQFSFSAYAWGQFKKNKPAYVSLWILGMLAIIAILAPVLANDQPLFAKYKGEVMFPAFSFKKSYEIKDASGKVERIQPDIAKWKQMELDAVIWAPVPYSPSKSDFLNSDFKGPSDPQKFRNEKGQIVDMPARFRHFLGTNKKGEDVLSGLIHAARVSLSIGIISMGIATLIGLVLGALAGYFGDNRLVTTRGRYWTFMHRTDNGLVLCLSGAGRCAGRCCRQRQRCADAATRHQLSLCSLAWQRCSRL